MTRRILLLSLCAAIAVALALPTQSHASESCYWCAASGHGGGQGCVLGPQGVSNGYGCYCYTNTKTHACQYGGCPCHCEGDPITSYICTCYCDAQTGRTMAATPRNIKMEHDKWLAEFKSEEEAGTLLPTHPIIWHARTASCLQNGGAFLIGMIAAASELGHPVKFNIGDPANDSLQDKIDQGLSIGVLAPPEPESPLPYVEMPSK